MKRIALVLIALVFVAARAEAHEKRSAGGYDYVVGFVNEPAFSGQMNGVDLRVSKGGEPVEGLEKTLLAIVSKDGKERQFDFRKKYKEPGRYAAYFLPSAAGDYAFRIQGKIGELDVDETFKSADGKFGGVTDSTEVSFP